MIGGAVAIGVSGGSTSRNKIVGEFYNIECRPPFYTIKGKISIKSNYNVAYNNIKVRLQGYLKSVSSTGTNNSYTTVDTSQDIFNSNPIEVVLLKSGGVLSGRTLSNFTINIPRDRVYPSPFMTSNGSLTYKLLILLNNNASLLMVTQKVVKFTGFHNIIGTELSPFIEEKLVDDAKITSIFTVPNIKIIMGCNESLNATLKLNGKIHNRVNATLKFIRNITYKRTKESKEIWSNTIKQRDEAVDILFEWSFVVPSMSRASYTHPLYSVQYFLNYEVTLADCKKNNSAIVEGLAEIQVGTARLPSFQLFGLLNMASGIQPSAPYEGKDIQPSAPYEDKDIQPSAPDTEKHLQPSAPRAQLDSSKSVVSLVSMLSLPPAYWDLRHRSGSSFSLETLPPSYDDL